MTDARVRRAFFLLMGMYAFLSAMLHRGGPSVREGLTLSPLASRGQALFRAQACHACHQIHGLGGFLGPDLTNVVRRRTRDEVAQVLADGRRQMPAFHLDDRQVDEVFAFLTEIDRTGTSTSSWTPAAIARVAWPDRFAFAHHERAPAHRQRLAESERLMRASACATCHRPFAAGRGGAPDLTLTRSRRTRDEVTRVLREGRGGMPGFGHLTDAQTARLADYVWWLGERRGELARAIAGPGVRVAWMDVPWFEID